MATIIGPQTLTIGTQTDIVFDNAWVPKYHNELKKGNTTVKKAPTSYGEAILRISHQVTKGIEGHVVSLEVEGVRGTVPAKRLAKCQIVLTCEDGDAAEASLLVDITECLCEYLPTVIVDVMKDMKD